MTDPRHIHGLPVHQVSPLLLLWQPTVALLLLLVPPWQPCLPSARAQQWDAFSALPQADVSRPKWMSHLADTLPLSSLSVPGTHDSMAVHGGDFVQCQSLSLAQQLEAGIRALDIRCRHLSDRFPVYHGIVYQYADFADVLAAVKGFLTVNPRETVLMRVKEEGDAVGNTRTFAQTFLGYAVQYPGLFWRYTGGNDPTLGEVRGKVVLLQNFDGPLGSSDFGIPWEALNKQDNWNLQSRWDLYGKWEAVKGQLAAAINGDPGNPETVYVNFLSASGEALVFPWFVASGQTSPGSRTLMPTGLTTLFSPTSYPDFPRQDCTWVFCNIVFLGTNLLAADYLSSNRGRVGVIYSDFPGGVLINEIISMNGV